MELKKTIPKHTPYALLQENVYFFTFGQGKFAKLPVRKFELTKWIEFEKTIPKHTHMLFYKEMSYFFHIWTGGILQNYLYANLS